MDFRSYLKNNAQKVDISLEDILSGFEKETKKTNPKLLIFAKELSKSCKGGKGIRGVLVKLGYEIAQTVTLSRTKGIYSSPSAQNDSKEILKIGTAFEILHSSLLIHDDIIDRSPTRRGKPSLHVSLGDNHYGISQAISLGDIGLYLSVKIISESNFPDSIKVKALNCFSQILINTGWGQIMDVEKDKDVTFVNLFKTAKYTIAGPLQMGAILGQGGETLTKKLGEFGEIIGIAFQIQDDILDFEVKDIKKSQIQKKEYAAKAEKIIPEITKDQKMKELLESMCSFLIERTK